MSNERLPGESQYDWWWRTQMDPSLFEDPEPEPQIGPMLSPFTPAKARQTYPLPPLPREISPRMGYKHKPLIVGQAAPREHPKPPAFQGLSGKRLSDLLGEDWSYRFDAVNLIPSYPGPRHRGNYTMDRTYGDQFPRHIAKGNAEKIKWGLTPRFLILCGRSVGRAFENRLGFKEWRYFEINETGVHTCALFPHPSGLNRHWNHPDDVARCRAFLRRVAGLPY